MKRPSYASARSQIKNAIEAALDNWDERSLPLPSMLIVKITKRDQRHPATVGNLIAEIVEFT